MSPPPPASFKDPMPSFRYLLAPLAACVLLSGCLMNSTRPLPTGAVVKPGRAIVVYGIGIESNWKYPELGVVLEEYSLAKQNITGNCMFHNQLDASIPSAPGPVRYVAFDVVPGHYIFSPFNAARFRSDMLAFEAPSGRAVYIGDFIYTHEKEFVLRRDRDTFERARKQALPDLDGEVLLAQSQEVKGGTMFLCMP